jgi:uncharacterized protein
VSGTLNTDYASLGDAFARAGIVPGPAEWHGALCGLLCSAGADAGTQWLEESLGEGAADNDQEGELRSRLAELGANAWRALCVAEMTFEPLLPGEERPLAERVQALAEWCQGFLSGLGQGGIDPQAMEGADAESIAEIFTDFAEISRAALDVEEPADPNEPDFALAEVKEYVRVSVQIVFEELAAFRTARDQRTLH